MDAFRAIACVAACAVLSGVPLADAANDCKNHYILDYPCSASWVEANEGLGGLDVHALAIDPVDSAKLYAGGFEALFRSVDGGRSWLPTALGTEQWTPAVRSFYGPPLAFVTDHVVKLIAVNPENPRILYAATHSKTGCAWFQRRFFKSVDAGVSWSEDLTAAIGGCERITALAFDPNDPQSLYFSHFDYLMGDTYAPFRTSQDAGLTWNYYFQPLVPVLAVDPHLPGTLYGGTLALDWGWWKPTGVLKSVDKGVTWTSTALAGRGVSAIATATGSGALYAATFTQEFYSKPQIFEGIFQSLDGGESWSASIGLETLLGTTATVTALVTHPENDRVVYAGTLDAGVWRSVDGGATWAAFNVGLPSLAIRSLVTSRGNPNMVYAATPLGVFRIVDVSSPRIGSKRVNRR